MDRYRKTGVVVVVCACAALLGGCGVTLGDVGDGVWDVTVWTVEGTGEVVKAVAVTAVDVTGAVVRKAASEGASTSADVQRAGLPAAAVTPAIPLPVSVAPVR